jgi:DNA-directed RNA polymerase subunit RPC12/RpoP
LFVIPLLLLIGAFNFYSVRFCDACGATVGLELFIRESFARHCPYCGFSLAKEERPSNVKPERIVDAVERRRREREGRAMTHDLPAAVSA